MLFLQQLLCIFSLFDFFPIFTWVPSVQTCLVTSSFWDICMPNLSKQAHAYRTFFTHSPKESLLQFNPVACMVGRVVEWLSHITNPHQISTQGRAFKSRSEIISFFLLKYTRRVTHMCHNPWSRDFTKLIIYSIPLYCQSLNSLYIPFTPINNRSFVLAGS